MTKRTTLHLLVMGALGLCLVERRAGADARPKPRRDRVALAQMLPALDGRHLEVTITEVNYEPGDVSPPHSHSCPVMVYVVEGAIRTQVKGEPEAIYHAGQTFFEAAHGMHLVAANASQKAPAKFLAMAVCDHKGPLSMPLPKQAQ
jgi:quercetin dioxygenase-like cupin family protein